MRTPSTSKDAFQTPIPTHSSSRSLVSSFVLADFPYLNDRTGGQDAQLSHSIDPSQPPESEENDQDTITVSVNDAVCKLTAWTNLAEQEPDNPFRMRWQSGDLYIDWSQIYYGRARGNQRHPTLSPIDKYILDRNNANRSRTNPAVHVGTIRTMGSWALFGVANNLLHLPTSAGIGFLAASAFGSFGFSYAGYKKRAKELDGLSSLDHANKTVITRAQTMNHALRISNTPVTITICADELPERFGIEDSVSLTREAVLEMLLKHGGQRQRRAEATTESDKDASDRPIQVNLKPAMIVEDILRDATHHGIQAPAIDRMLGTLLDIQALQDQDAELRTKMREVRALNNLSQEAVSAKELVISSLVAQQRPIERKITCAILDIIATSFVARQAPFVSGISDLISQSITSDTMHETDRNKILAVAQKDYEQQLREQIGALHPFSDRTPIESLASQLRSVRSSMQSTGNQPL